MNPEQQNGQYTGAPSTPPQPGEPGHDPYGFILNPEKPAKPPMKLLPSGNSTLQRAAIFGGGLAVLLILVIVVMSFVSKGSQTGTEDIVAVAQQQTELARIATDGTENATSSTTKNLAANLQASMTSAQQQTVAYLKTTHHKVSTKTLSQKKSSTTDTTLQNAKDAGTYDSTFTNIVQQDLTAYAAQLETAYKTKPGPKGEALLNSQYEAAKLLNTQSQQN